MKKAYTIFLTIVYCICGLYIFDFEANCQTNNIFYGYTSVETTEDLYNIRNDLSGKYYLKNDIIFNEMDFVSSGSFYNNGEGWEPIGTEDSPFRGILDGNGYNIQGLYIDAVSESEDDIYFGLFGVNYGTIKNLGIENGTMTILTQSEENIYLGAFTGDNRGHIKNCKNTNTVACHMPSNGANIGGITGLNSNEISICSNWGSVGSREMAGGIAGLNIGNINDCFNAGDVTSVYGTGGIVGYNYKGTIQRCYSAAEITSVLGGRSGSGELVGYLYGGEVSACYYYDKWLGSGEEYISNVNNCSEGEMLMAPTYKEFDFENIWTMDTNMEYAYPVHKKIEPIITEESDKEEAYEQSSVASMQEETLTDIENNDSNSLEDNKNGSTIKVIVSIIFIILLVVFELCFYNRKAILDKIKQKEKI